MRFLSVSNNDPEVYNVLINLTGTVTKKDEVSFANLQLTSGLRMIEQTLAWVQIPVCKVKY